MPVFLTVLSEQHPREQGLKHQFAGRGTVQDAAFRATSKRTRIETSSMMLLSMIMNSAFRATSKRTRIETCKSNSIWYDKTAFRATSKRTRIETVKDAVCALRRWNFQSNIQENKDWNTEPACLPGHHFPAFRATSKRTRIETLTENVAKLQKEFFQSNIQENKDWNPILYPAQPGSPYTFRATSKRTRIETRFDHRCTLYIRRFQSNIQENKDWNYQSMSVHGTTCGLSEQHPREQGLKQVHRGPGCSVTPAFRATSKRTRIETCCVSRTIRR